MKAFISRHVLVVRMLLVSVLLGFSIPVWLFGVRYSDKDDIESLSHILEPVTSYFIDDEKVSIQMMAILGWITDFNLIFACIKLYKSTLEIKYFILICCTYIIYLPIITLLVHIPNVSVIDISPTFPSISLLIGYDSRQSTFSSFLFLSSLSHTILLRTIPIPFYWAISIAWHGVFIFIGLVLRIFVLPTIFFTLTPLFLFDEIHLLRDIWISPKRMDKASITEELTIPGMVEEEPDKPKSVEKNILDLHFDSKSVDSDLSITDEIDSKPPQSKTPRLELDSAKKTQSEEVDEETKIDSLLMNSHQRFAPMEQTTDGVKDPKEILALFEIQKNLADQLKIMEKEE